MKDEVQFNGPTLVVCTQADEYGSVWETPRQVEDDIHLTIQLKPHEGWHSADKVGDAYYVSWEPVRG